VIHDKQSACQSHVYRVNPAKQPFGRLVVSLPGGNLSLVPLTVWKLAIWAVKATIDSMDTAVTMPWEILDRMEQAVAKVRERLLRTTAALNKAGVAYAVVGGHAVASWVAKVDEGAVRNTRDVHLLVRREDMSVLTAALEQAGFILEKSFGVTMFLDGPNAKPSESVHLLFANEKVRENDPALTPDIVTVDDPAGFRVLTLESLLRMKLLANRRKDQVHIQDLIGVGLIDSTWLSKLPPVLAERLQAILDTPDG
jgi:hypothetical protein